MDEEKNTKGKLFEMCYEHSAFHQAVTRASKSHIRNMIRLILIDGETPYIEEMRGRIDRS